MEVLKLLQQTLQATGLRSPLLSIDVAVGEFVEPLLQVGAFDGCRGGNRLFWVFCLACVGGVA
jgi:hypothetical protein